MKKSLGIKKIALQDYEVGRIIGKGIFSGYRLRRIRESQTSQEQTDGPIRRLENALQAGYHRVQAS